MKKLVLLLVILAAGFAYFRISTADPATNQPTIKQEVKPMFSKTKYSISDPSSIWIVANKKRPLSPSNYAPKDLTVPHIKLRLGSGAEEMHVRQETANALLKMATAAAKDNMTFILASGYRSYSLQTGVYASEVSRFGKTVADSESARPGFSEHQTGFAADIEPGDRQCEIQDCFANTSIGKWLATNSWKYGFILRYPKDKTSVTGYRFEPWHFRYVGVELSTEMHNKKITTLEEFFELPNAPAY